MKKSFTLIEILVVVTIIGLLTATAAVTYTAFLKQSRDAKRKTDLSQLATALEMYRSNNDAYPSTSLGWWGACSSYGSFPDTGATGYVPGLAPVYILKLPHDPRESQSFPPCSATGSTCYLYRSDGKDYKLLAHCAPEVAVPSTDQFYDPTRPTWALQVSSSSNSLNW